MGILDSLFSTEEKDQTPVLNSMSKVEVKPLQPADLEYMDNVSVDLGYDRNSIQSKEDWDVMNKHESDRIKAEEEASMYSAVDAYAVTGEGKQEVLNRSMGLARVDALGETIPSAAALSAERERLAESAVFNPQNAEDPAAYQRWLHSFNERSAINEDRIHHFARKASQNSSMLKNFTLDMLPLTNKARVKEAMEALGYKDLDKYSYDQLLSLFGETVSFLTAAEGYSTLDHLEAWKEIEDRWDKAGIDPFIQSQIVESLSKFEPGAETLNETLRWTGILPSVGMLAKGAKLYKGGHKAAGLYKIATAPVEAVVPYGEELTDRVVLYSFPKISKAARKVRDVYGSIPFIKARREKNRASAMDIVKETYGAPTVTERGYDYMNGAAKFDLTDHAMHPVGDVNISASNEAYTLSLKIDKEVNAALNQYSKRKSLLRSLTEEAWNSYVKNDLVDTLKMNKIIGAGRGVGINDIISAFDTDAQFTKTGENIVVAVRLKNPANSSKYKSMRIENAPEEIYGKGIPKNFDSGFLAADERGKKMVGSGSIKSSKGEEVGLSYRVDEVDGEYYTTLLIDTNKGLGKLHFERLQREGKETQEEWRALMSSWATATSDPTDIQFSNLAREIDASTYREIGDDVYSSIKALPKDEQKLFQALVDVSTEYGAFYSTEHILGRGSSEALATAYAKWRALNDFDDFVKNEYTRRDLMRRGAKAISFNGQSIAGYGRVVPGINSWTDMKNVATGGGDAKKARGLLIDRVDIGEYPPIDATKLTPEQWKDYYNKGYRLIEGSLSPEEGYGARTFYYLLDPQATVINDLPEFVTSYVAGGRRYFDRRRGFLKQLRIVTKPNGREAIVGSNTFFTDIDEVGLKRRAVELERIRRLIIDGKDAEATALIAAADWHKTEIHDAASFRAFFEERGMDFVHKENSLEVVKNGRMLDSYKALRNADNVDDLVGFDEMERLAHNSHFQALSNEAKQLKKKRTGRELLTWDFEKAQTVDFEQQIKYLVNDMVFNDTMGLYTDMYANRFYDTFKGVIKNPRGYEMTAREALIDGEIIEGSDLSRAAKTAQANYAAIRGTPSMLDEALASNFNRMMDWIGNVAEGVLPISEKAAHGVRVGWKSITEADPLSYMRALASHWYLGSLNPSQLYKQMASDLSILLLEPKAALKAIPESLKITSVLMLSKGNKAKALELAKKIYKNDRRMLINMENIIDMGAFEHGTAGGYFEKGFSTKDKLNRLSMLFFNTGEMQNRATAYYASILSKGFDGIKMSNANKVEVAKYAQTLFMNMDAAGLSRIQRGTVEKTLFQFMGYRMRWAEQVMFNKELTRAQKIRLGLGTLALTGTQGFLGVGASTWVATNLYNLFVTPEHTDLTLEDRNEFSEFVQKGIINYFSEIFGIDMDLAQPFSLEYAELVDSIMGLSQMDFAAPQVAGKALSAIMEMAALIRDSVIGEATAEDFGNLLDSLATEGKLPSSARVYLGMRLYKTGRALSSKGELSEYYNSKLRTVLYSLGFNSLHGKELTRAWMQSSITKEAVSECEKASYALLLRALETNSARDWQYFDASIKMSGLDERLQAKIFRDDMERASKNTQIPALARRLTDQLKSSGLYGNNVIQLIYTKGENYGR